VRSGRVRATATRPARLSLHDALPIFWAEKKSALETIFAAGRSRARQRAFQTYRAEQGRALEDFALWCAAWEDGESSPEVLQQAENRKSTRLNSSHVSISYAVFCLQKK